MKKILYKFLLFSLAFGLVSCEKFLDEPPLHELVQENAITNSATAQAAVKGIYYTFQNASWGGSLYATYASKSGFARYNSTDYTMAYTQAIPTSTAVFEWTAFYKSMNAANFTINGIEALSEIQIQSAEKKKLIAEAKCLRAFVNAQLLWCFAHWWAEDTDEFGILYRDEAVNLGNVQKARISVGESYTKIYEDLDYAIANLPDYTSGKYASKQFAKALKAKLLLYRGGYRNSTADLETALTLVNDVLNNHPASFGMEANLSDVYKNSWDSKECLFVRYLEDDGNRKTTGYYYSTTLVRSGTRLPSTLPITAGLVYGADWFRENPRWPVVTGPIRPAEAWDVTYYHGWTKLSRYGAYMGSLSTDPTAEKYAAYHFRYPELYLMKAELLARTGASIADAIAPINLMRSKRVTPVLPALNPANQEELMTMIFKEIFLETYLENGSEFFAATRFKNAGEPMLTTIKGGTVPFVENKLCLPIPDAEMLNNTKMVQNPE